MERRLPTFWKDGKSLNKNMKGTGKGQETFLMKEGETRGRLAIMQIGDGKYMRRQKERGLLLSDAEIGAI